MAGEANDTSGDVPKGLSIIPGKWSYTVYGLNIIHLSVSLVLLWIRVLMNFMVYSPIRNRINNHL